MVLAEVIASGELQEVAREVAADVAHVRSHHLKGEALAEGVALGHAVLHEPRVVITNLIAENIPKEKQRLEEAVAAAARPCRRAGRRHRRAAGTRIFRGARNLPHVRA